VMALWFLDENLGVYKALGIMAGILAVFLLYRRSGSSRTPHGTFSLYFSLAIAASLLRACYGVTSKAGLLHGANLQSMLVISALSWVVGGAAYAIVREKRFRLTAKKAAYSLLSGALVFHHRQFSAARHRPWSGQHRHPHCQHELCSGPGPVRAAGDGTDNQTQALGGGCSDLLHPSAVVILGK